jgi:DNA repair protein RecO (recombination protein O)
MFLSEILHHSIHEEEKNEALFVLEVALFWLDADEIANFHLVLLLEVSKYLGFILILRISICLFEMTEGVLHRLAL